VVFTACDIVCVTRWLSEEEAAESVSPRLRAYVAAAWRFLTTSGYINFGVAPAILVMDEQIGGFRIF
jgi:hypothetical protein